MLSLRKRHIVRLQCAAIHCKNDFSKPCQQKFCPRSTIPCNTMYPQPILFRAQNISQKNLWYASITVQKPIRRCNYDYFAHDADNRVRPSSPSPQTRPHQQKCLMGRLQNRPLPQTSQTRPAHNGLEGGRYCGAD